MRSWVTERRFGPRALVKRLGDREVVAFGLKRYELVRRLSGFEGKLVFPFSKDYDEDRRVHNRRFNQYPLVIAYCTSDNDVAIALTLARNSPFPFRVRAGGHSPAGYSSLDGGIIIDVSELSGVAVDSQEQTVTIGTGARFGAINRVLETYQAHIPGPECNHVAMGGCLQGGGYGLTSRTFGMNCDNVLSMRVMLADGTIVQASPSTNADLFWAMRGGTGNNFGILLSATYKLHQMDTVYGWRLRWPLNTNAQRKQAADAMVTVQKTFIEAPNEFNIQVAVLYPETETKDTEPELWVYGVYVGTEAQGKAAIGALAALSGATLDIAEQGKFADIQKKLVNPPPFFPDADFDTLNEVQISRYTPVDKSDFWTSARWQSLFDMFVFPVGDRWNYFWLEVYGGAINSYAVDQSAFIHRDKVFNACLDVFWNEEDQNSNPGGGRYGSAQQILKDWSNFVAPAWDGEVYQNLPEDMPYGTDYAEAYWGKALPALMAVKRKYDPQGLFNFPQAIPDRKAAAVAWPADVAKALAQPIQPEKAPDIWSRR